MLFCDSLPFAVVDALGAKDLDIQLTLSGIYTSHEFVLYETGNICEGVLKVLTGEDSPSNLVAFIEKDEHIEEDNRPKIAELAYEIQTKIFDQVLPILKQAGFPIKEGRVAEPVMKYEVGSRNYGGQTISSEQGVLSPYAPVESPLSGSSFSKGGAEGGGFKIPPASKSGLPLGKGETPLRAEDGGAPLVRGESAQLPLDDKNVRALVRIASGTTYSEEKLRDAFADLPQGLRQSISSVDTANAIQEIAKKYLLHVDQMGALASETGLVLLGLTHPAEFIGNLAKRLRLPEEKAKEIARDISAEILVKVREALRGLHENAENPKTQAPRPTLQSQSSVGQANSKQNTNTQNQPNQSKEPLKQFTAKPTLSDSSFSKGGAEGGGFKIPPSSGVLPLEKGELPKVNTPYSVGAKWNTGENILAKQAVQKEEALSRAEVLRGIENPSELQVPSSKFTGQPKTSNLQPKTLVGPTGWKPSASPSYENTNGTNIRMNTNKKEDQLPPVPMAQGVPIPQKPSLPTPPAVPRPTLPSKPTIPPAMPPRNEVGSMKYEVERNPTPIAPAQKARPQSESLTPPTPPAKGKADDFLSQKLQAPMSTPREEKRYTTDPYREPLQ